MNCIFALIFCLLTPSLHAEVCEDITNHPDDYVPQCILMKAAEDLSRGDREYKVALIAVFDKEVFGKVYDIVKDIPKFDEYTKLDILKLSMHVCLFESMGENRIEAMAKVLNSPEDYLE